MSSKYHYKAFGLSIGSDIEFPELLRLNTGEIPDVIIRQGAVPDTLEAPLKNGIRYQAKKDQLLLNLDGIARFHVRCGNRVTVAKAAGAKDKDVRAILLGSVFGALIHQRALLPMHASSIRVKDGCVMFCGASGSGKSTIANILVRRGYRLNADDITVVSTGERSQPLVYPGYPAFKLWEDALMKSGENPGFHSRLRAPLKKYLVPVTQDFNQDALPIRKVYVLLPHNKDTIAIEGLKGIQKFAAVQHQTYKPKFVKFMKSGKNYFQTVSTVSSQVSVSAVHRPITPFLPDRLADILEEDFSR